MKALKTPLVVWMIFTIAGSGFSNPLTTNGEGQKAEVQRAIVEVLINRDSPAAIAVGVSGAQDRAWREQPSGPQFKQQGASPEPTRSADSVGDVYDAISNRKYSGESSSEKHLQLAIKEGIKTIPGASPVVSGVNAAESSAASIKEHGLDTALKLNRIGVQSNVDKTARPLQTEGAIDNFMAQRLKVNSRCDTGLAEILHRGGYVQGMSVQEITELYRQDPEKLLKQLPIDFKSHLMAQRASGLPPKKRGRSEEPFENLDESLIAFAQATQSKNPQGAERAISDQMKSTKANLKKLGSKSDGGKETQEVRELRNRNFKAKVGISKLALDVVARAAGDSPAVQGSVVVGKAILDTTAQFSDLLAKKIINSEFLLGACTNWVGAAMQLMSLFSNAKSPEQQILEKLAEMDKKLDAIKKQIDRLSNQMADGFFDLKRQLHSGVNLILESQRNDKAHIDETLKALNSKMELSIRQDQESSERQVTERREDSDRLNREHRSNLQDPDKNREKFTEAIEGCANGAMCTSRESSFSGDKDKFKSASKNAAAGQANHNRLVAEQLFGKAARRGYYGIAYLDSVYREVGLGRRLSEPSDINGDYQAPMNMETFVTRAENLRFSSGAPSQTVVSSSDAFEREMMKLTKVGRAEHERGLQTKREKALCKYDQRDGHELFLIAKTISQGRDHLKYLREFSGADIDGRAHATHLLPLIKNYLGALSGAMNSTEKDYGLHLKELRKNFPIDTSVDIHVLKSTNPALYDAMLKKFSEDLTVSEEKRIGFPCSGALAGDQKTVFFEMDPAAIERLFQSLPKEAIYLSFLGPYGTRVKMGCNSHLADRKQRLDSHDYKLFWIQEARVQLVLTPSIENANLKDSELRLFDHSHAEPKVSVIRAQLVSSKRLHERGQHPSEEIWNKFSPNYCFETFGPDNLGQVGKCVKSFKSLPRTDFIVAHRVESKEYPHLQFSIDEQLDGENGEGNVNPEALWARTPLRTEREKMIDGIQHTSKSLSHGALNQRLTQALDEHHKMAVRNMNELKIPTAAKEVQGAWMLLAKGLEIALGDSYEPLPATWMKALPDGKNLRDILADENGAMFRSAAERQEFLDRANDSLTDLVGFLASKENSEHLTPRYVAFESELSALEARYWVLKKNLEKSGCSKFFPIVDLEHDPVKAAKKDGSEYKLKTENELRLYVSGKLAPDLDGALSALITGGVPVTNALTTVDMMLAKAVKDYRTNVVEREGSEMNFLAVAHGEIEKETKKYSSPQLALNSRVVGR